MVLVLVDLLRDADRQSNFSLPQEKETPLNNEGSIFLGGSFRLEIIQYKHMWESSNDPQ